MSKTYILDTNIILDDVNNIKLLYDGHNTIIIPETVIDELDNKKTNFDETGFQAREFARLIENMKPKQIFKSANGEYLETLLESSDLKLKITSKTSYQTYNEHQNIVNDRKIIEVAKLYKDGIFITYDSMCKIRALSEGVKVQTLGSKKETSKLEIIKELKIHDVNLVQNNEDIRTYDDDYKTENYSYIFKDDKQQILVRVVNGLINIVNEKNLEKQDVKPINMRQKLFTDAILDDRISIVAVNAPAGVGKTLLSLATAMRLVKEKKFSKIIYIRNSIESVDKGEDIGYLAGNEEKLAVYNHPLYDSIEFIARKRLERSNTNKSIKTVIDQDKLKAEIKDLISKNNIETMWVGELRGRTITDAVVIVDEIQNMSQKTALTTLSRVDKTCKVIAMGSNRQIDNPYINKYNNALTTLIEAGKETHNINMCVLELTNVVRGPITEFAENVFSKN